MSDRPASFQTLAGEGQNRYKWLKFSEQLARVDIGAVRRIGAVYEQLPEVRAADIVETVAAHSSRHAHTLPIQ